MFLYDSSLRHERINYFHLKAQSHLFENLPLSRVKLLYQNLELNNQVNRNIPRYHQSMNQMVIPQGVNLLEKQSGNYKWCG